MLLKNLNEASKLIYGCVVEFYLYCSGSLVWCSVVSLPVLVIQLPFFLFITQKAASCRSSKNVLKPKNLPFQEISNTVSYAEKGDQATKSRKGPLSRIPRRCANNNKNEHKTTSSPSNNSDKNDAKDNDDQRSPSLEKSVNLNDVFDGKEIIPTTPAGCIAARIRSYSALRRSQWKKNGKDCSSDSNKENTCCSPAKTMSLLEETDCDPMSTEVENNSDLSSENESDEDILWKMSRRHCSEKEDMSHAKVSEINKAY